MFVTLFFRPEPDAHQEDIKKIKLQKVSTVCKLPMKFEPMKGKIILAPTLIQPITKLVQILNFMGNLHAVLSLQNQPRSQGFFPKKSPGNEVAAKRQSINFSSLAIAT